MSSGFHEILNDAFTDATLAQTANTAVPLSIIIDREREKEKIESHIIYGHGA